MHDIGRLGGHLRVLTIAILSHKNCKRNHARGTTHAEPRKGNDDTTRLGNRDTVGERKKYTPFHSWKKNSHHCQAINGTVTMTNAAQNDNWSIMRRRNVRPAPPLGKRDVYKSCGTTTEEGAGFGQPCLGANVLTAVRNPARYPEISRQWKDLDTFPRCNESSGRHFMKYWGGGACQEPRKIYISVPW